MTERTIFSSWSPAEKPTRPLEGQAKISDMIDFLTRQKEEHGDLHVVLDWDVDVAPLRVEDMEADMTEYGMAEGEIRLCFYPR